MREALISVYREHGRHLPWRNTRDPWRVLVSEVMLQQIQVVRAIPFYERFLERFPTVEALALAPVADAIRAWGDLGRYRRVVNLHRSARIIVEEHGGKVPSDPASLIKLPGVGPYTAGAVACFAFEKDVAFLDTNMRRVLHRIFVGPDVPNPTATDRELLDVAGRLVPPGGRLGVEPGADGVRSHALLRPQARVRRLPRAGPSVAHVPAWDPPSRRCRVPRGRSPAAGTRTPTAYHRGRVLAHLREDAAASGQGIALRDLGRRLRDGFEDEDLPWISGVVDSLRKDGLAVAEERAPYGSEDGEEPWVMLP